MLAPYLAYCKDESVKRKVYDKALLKKENTEKNL